MPFIHEIPEEDKAKLLAMASSDPMKLEDFKGEVNYANLSEKKQRKQIKKRMVVIEDASFENYYSIVCEVIEKEGKGQFPNKPYKPSVRKYFDAGEVSPVELGRKFINDWSQ